MQTNAGERESAGPKDTGRPEGGSGLKADQKHFQVKIKLCRLQEANLMGNIPCSPCPLLWLPMGRGLLVRETPGHQILSK